MGRSPGPTGRGPALRDRSGADCFAKFGRFGGVDSNRESWRDKLGVSRVVVAALEPLLTRELPRFKPAPLEKTSRTLKRLDRVRDRPEPGASGRTVGKLYSPYDGPGGNKVRICVRPLQRSPTH